MHHQPRNDAMQGRMPGCGGDTENKRKVNLSLVWDDIHTYWSIGTNRQTFRRKWKSPTGARIHSEPVKASVCENEKELKRGSERAREREKENKQFWMLWRATRRVHVAAACLFIVATCIAHAILYEARNHRLKHCERGKKGNKECSNNNNKTIIHKHTQRDRASERERGSECAHEWKNGAFSLTLSPHQCWNTQRNDTNIYLVLQPTHSSSLTKNRMHGRRHR